MNKNNGQKNKQKKNRAAQRLINACAKRCVFKRECSRVWEQLRIKLCSSLVFTWHRWFTDKDICSYSNTSSLCHKGFLAEGDEVLWVSLNIVENHKHVRILLVVN